MSKAKSVILFPSWLKGWGISMQKLLTLSFIFFSALCFSQKQDRIWCFGLGSGIDFNDTLNPVPFSSAITSNALASYSSVANRNGNLLFYAAGVKWDTLGFKIWNRNHVVMQNGDSIAGHPNRPQVSIIVPFPSDTNKYYLFSTSYIANMTTLCYSIIDMQQAGGLGAVTQKNIFMLYDSLSEKLNAVRHANGRDWWLITRKYTDNTYYKYLITPAGITGPTVQTLGTANGLMYFGAMEFSTNGDKVVAVSNFACIDLMDFDRCSGILSNFIDLGEHISPVAQVEYFSCTFSPDETKLYVSTSPSNINEIKQVYQYDMTASDIMASKQVVCSYSDTLNFFLGMMRLAPDGKIYIAKSAGYSADTNNVYDQNLDYITDPNQLGSACNYCPNCFNLQGHGLSKLGLPNNPNYNLGEITGGPCDSLDLGIIGNYFVPINYNVCPNPFHEKTVLSISEYCYACGLEVYDALGEQVLLKNFSGRQTEIMLSGMKPGIYFFSVYDKNKKIAQGKLVAE